MRPAQRSSSPAPTRPAPKALRAEAAGRYPESDGRPMAETPVHWHAMVDFASPLHGFFKDRPDAYVGSNMLMCHEEGDNRRSVSPDVFVAFGVPKLPERRVWLVWEERKAADFVPEVTSRSTRREDEVGKKALYARLEVREYWQFDPLGECLNPRLRGYVLGADGKCRQVDLEERGGALCHDSLLGATLRLEDGRLRLHDPMRGECLLTHAEEREARRLAEVRLAELERRLRCVRRCRPQSPPATA